MYNKLDEMEYQNEKLVVMLYYNNDVKPFHLIAMVLTLRVSEELLHSLMNSDHLYDL